MFHILFKKLSPTISDGLKHLCEATQWQQLDTYLWLIQSKYGKNINFHSQLILWINLNIDSSLPSLICFDELNKFNMHEKRTINGKICITSQTRDSQISQRAGIGRWRIWDAIQILTNIFVNTICLNLEN